MSSTTALEAAVKRHFDLLKTDEAFFKFMRSTNNKNAITGNRLFDRLQAVKMIMDAAKCTGDVITAYAKEGEIYRCLVKATRPKAKEPRRTAAEWKRRAEENLAAYHAAVEAHD